MLRSALFALLSVPLLVTASAAEQVPVTDSNLSTTSDAWSWSSCDSYQDYIELYSIELKPDPPVPGENLTVIVNGKVKETIEEGAAADVTVKLGYIKLLQKEFDICEEARNANATVQCPLEPGEYTVEQTVALPKEIPQAKFTVHVDGYTVDDDDLLCLDLSIDFRKKASFLPW